MGRFTNIKRLSGFPPEEIELAMGWLRGELSLSDIAQARGKFNASNGLNWAASRLREAWRQGLIKDGRSGSESRGTFAQVEDLLVDKPPGGVV